LNKDFTTAVIATKQYFTYGRFEIRAALPKGKMLGPFIGFIPTNVSGWARNGRIEVMNYFQNNELQAGLVYNDPYIYEVDKYSTNSNLNDFHTYSIEWDKFQIKWFFDETEILTINISRNLGSIYSRKGEPFDQPFRLTIHLDINKFVGPFFPHRPSVLDDVMDWKCSLFIIDYVRIYNWVDRYENSSISSYDISADKICEAVMSIIRPNKTVNELNSTNIFTKPNSQRYLPKIKPDKKEDLNVLTIIFSVIGSVSLIVLISIIVYLLIPKRNLKRNIIKGNLENYDDTHEPEKYDDIREPEKYDAIYNVNEYAHNYEEVIEYRVGNEDTDKYKVIIHEKEEKNSLPIYLAIE
jgi:hypothetical protein